MRFRLVAGALAIPIGFVLVGALAGLGWAQLRQPQYVATTTVFVSVQQGANLADLAQGAVLSQQVLTAYTAVVPTPAVLDPAIARAGLRENAVDLAKRITVTNPQGTAVLAIAVTDPSAARAARIANAVEASLAEVAAKLTPPTADTAAPVRFAVMQPATPPDAPQSPRTLQAVAIGAGAGLALALFVALVRDAIRHEEAKRQVQIARRLERERMAAG